MRHQKPSTVLARAYRRLAYWARRTKELQDQQAKARPTTTKGVRHDR